MQSAVGTSDFRKMAASVKPSDDAGSWKLEPCSRKLELATSDFRLLEARVKPNGDSGSRELE